MSPASPLENYPKRKIKIKNTNSVFVKVKRLLKLLTQTPISPAKKTGSHYSEARLSTTPIPSPLLSPHTHTHTAVTYNHTPTHTHNHTPKQTHTQLSISFLCPSLKYEIYSLLGIWEKVSTNKRHKLAKIKTFERKWVNVNMSNVNILREMRKDTVSTEQEQTFIYF